MTKLPEVVLVMIISVSEYLSLNILIYSTFCNKVDTMYLISQFPVKSTLNNLKVTEYIYNNVIKVNKIIEGFRFTLIWMPLHLKLFINHKLVVPLFKKFTTLLSCIKFETKEGSCDFFCLVLHNFPFIFLSKLLFFV